MTLVPNYLGPSPASKQFTCQGVQCVLDLYYNPGGTQVQGILAEKNAAGAWEYLHSIDGALFIINTSDNPVGQYQHWNVPPPADGVPGQSLTYGNGTFLELVNGRGAEQMWSDLMPYINQKLAARFPAGSSGGGSVVPQPALAVDQQAQQALAQALYDHVSVSGGVPPVVTVS